MEIDKAKYEAVMTKYAQLTGPGLELKTAAAFTTEVKKSVVASQKHADAVVNLISARKRTDEKAGVIEDVPADYDSAREALLSLAKSVGPVAEHWRPFIELASDALEIHIGDVLPRGMIPDPAAMEDALYRADQAIRAREEHIAELTKEEAKLEAENLELKKKLSDAGAQLDSAALTLKSANDALEVANKSLESAKKSQADLAAENEALKHQLAAHTKTEAKGSSSGGKHK